MRKRIQYELKAQHLPKQEIDYTLASGYPWPSDYPQFYNILNKIANKFKFNGNHMLTYLKEEKKS